MLKLTMEALGKQTSPEVASHSLSRAEPTRGSEKGELHANRLTPLVQKDESLMS